MTSSEDSFNDESVSAGFNESSSWWASLNPFKFGSGLEPLKPLPAEDPQEVRQLPGTNETRGWGWDTWTFGGVLQPIQAAPAPLPQPICSDPSHERHRKGPCESCGVCKKCQPPETCDLPETHIGTWDMRIQKSPAWEFRRTTPPRASVSHTTLSEVEDVPCREGPSAKEIFNLFDIDTARREPADLEDASQRTMNDLVSIGAEVMDKFVAAVIKRKRGDDDSERSLRRRLAAEISPESLSSLDERVLELHASGSTTTRRIARAVLAKALPYNDFFERIEASGSKEQREFEVKQRKCKSQTCKTRSVADGIDAIGDFAVKKSFSIDAKSFSQARDDFECLKRGGDLHQAPRASRVSPEQLLSAVLFVMDHSQYRPGKVRNVWVDGSLLKGLPMFVRSAAHEDLFKEYQTKARRLNQTQTLETLGDSQVKLFFQVNLSWCRRGPRACPVRKISSRLECPQVTWPSHEAAEA
eukprot:m.220168 g.220168  ORF g.220168 m.220168 type:complete len:470 (+) comp15593_c0_seq1:4358-5767(+)